MTLVADIGIVLKLRLSFLVVVQVFMFLILTLGNLKVFAPELIKKGRPSVNMSMNRKTLVSVDVFSDGVGSFVVNCNGLL